MNNTISSLSYKALTLLKNKHLTISFCESLTGGLLCDSLTINSGSSSVFLGGIVSYSNKIKKNVLGVSSIDKFGVISAETAIQMSKNGIKMFESDICIATTGVAGPFLQENKSVGMVFIAISSSYFKTIVKKLELYGDRRSIQEQTVINCYELLLNSIESNIF